MVMCRSRLKTVRNRLRQTASCLSSVSYTHLIEGTNIDAQASQAYDMPVGIFVYKILDDGAASNSDLKEKDIITKFDGQSVTTLSQLQNMLTYYEKGSKVTLTVQSLADGNYQEREVEVTLGSQQSNN